MAQVLTQSEIDALLNSLASGSDEAPPPTAEEDKISGAQLYDFRTANKFSKEQIRTLNNICDNFATVMSNSLTGLLRTLCEVRVLSVEEQLFGEFNNSIPMPSIIAVVDAEPLEGQMIFQMSSAVVYGIISCLFGGEADYSDVSKQFTEIDTAIMNNVVPQCLRLLQTAWEKVAQLHFKLDRIETNPQFTQVAGASEPSALMTFNVKIDAVEDMMTVCMPHYMIQPLGKELSSMAWTLNERATSNKGRDPRVKEQVLDTKVTLRTRFEYGRVTMRELLSMTPGSILTTNHRIQDFVLVDVEKLAKFQAVMGVCDDKRVVQIAKIMKEREDIE